MLGVRLRVRKPDGVRGGGQDIRVDVRAIVVGAGSIGQRHQRVLSDLGVTTALVSRRPDAAADYSDVKRAVEDWRPDHAVVATETTDHLASLAALAACGFTGSVVIEKPLAGSSSGAATASASAVGSGQALTHPFRALVVGYQLRRHPAVEAARELLAGQRILSVTAHVGQHLAAWRPGRDVADSASARVEDGGGVLRDLSHELDLVTWLAGGWLRVCAIGGRSGTLGEGVATDDRWAILLELEGGAVATVHLDALDHVGQRRLSLVGTDSTVALDLVAATLRSAGGATPAADGRSEPHTWNVGRDDVLARLHRSVLDGDVGGLCSFNQGMGVVRLIDAVERSAQEGRWVAAEEAA